MIFRHMTNIADDVTAFNRNACERVSGFVSLSTEKLLRVSLIVAK